MNKRDWETSGLWLALTTALVIPFALIGLGKGLWEHSPNGIWLASLIITNCLWGIIAGCLMVSKGNS